MLHAPSGDGWIAKCGGKCCHNLGSVSAATPTWTHVLPVLHFDLRVDVVLAMHSYMGLMVTVHCVVLAP